ncbi:hypothetical protein [Fluviicola taffensis]|uniref:Uncharacterized protein n=1 Tax=Fluviicola taffensis (strain DSM 16823 / NCIMB 13979 / RW262) TaxID=755732 RepID=F2IK53_FLUTR|nr:hypothetical protein [Fluviicola taffensis]AEA42952.1 hypothetical protein Fluta_0951 [Fluviicola taffensis DSM 16823]
MKLSLIIIKKYELNQTRLLFIQKLRSKTREPYFDNKNTRRLDIEDEEGTIYADEYDNMISLRNQVINKHWILFKTLILFGKRKKNYFWTISYPGHYATVLAILSIFGFFAGLYFFLTENEYKILIMSIGMYILTIYMSKDDYKSHHHLIKECNCIEE